MTTPDTWFPGGGDMGRRVRDLDWSATPLGGIESWPQSLRTAVRIILDSRYPMFVWWGDELTNIYNDSYADILGQRHPAALGQPAKQIWSDIWSAISPLVHTVIDENQATFNNELELFMERNNFVEETFFTFSYSPLQDPDTGERGLFCACYEDTERVVSERRLRLLRALGGYSRTVHSVAEALNVVEDSLGAYNRDVAFALLYREKNGDLVLAKAVGVDEGTGLAPSRVSATGNHSTDAELTNGIPVQELRAVFADGQARSVSANDVRLPLPGGEWPEPARFATVLPLTRGGEERIGVLVLGACPRRPFDDSYRQFSDLVANTVSSLISNADAYETERRRADALAELDRAKTLFFGNVSHEFRTPLTLIMSPIEELLNDDSLSALAHDQLELARRNGLRLLKLVNNLLDFSRIEAGRITANYEQVDLARTTTELASMFRSAIESAGLTLHVDCTPLETPAWVDRDMWEKIVMNLLSNALKYTLDGEVRVALRQVAGPAVELTVSDTGIGIPEADLPRIFERFHRVEGAHGRTQEGTGIGLALVRELCHLHGGTVDVESRPGVGSRFKVHVPLGNAHLPADRIRTSPQGSSAVFGVEAYVEEALRWLPEGSTDEHAETAMTSGELPALSPDKPLVLVADDNADMRAYLHRLLRRQYHVVVTSDGTRAAQLAEAQLPALVLSDVMMPGLDGFQLLAHLRANPSTRSIPVVLLSARAGEEARAEGLEAGADDYLVKPFHARELLARVGAQIQLANVRRGAEQRITELLEGSTSGFIMLDADRRYQYVNAAAEKLVGRERHEMIGRTPEEVFPEAQGTESLDILNRVIATGEPEETETYFEPWERWFRVRMEPLRTGGIIVQFDDVTLAQRALESMRETDRRKDEFLATLAHELRNPLAPLRNALQLLSHDERSDPGGLLAMMDRQTEHLTRLVDDLMEVSRINRGLVKLRRKRIDIASAVTSACESVQPDVMHRNQSLDIEVPDHPLYVDADAVRLTQVVANLLGNASKYTPDGGHLKLIVEATDDTVEIVVRDDGIGIEPGDIDDLFSPFLQAGNVTSRYHSGLGLGLTVVRELVERHDGRVEASSPGPGQGSTFRVVLPRCRPEAEAGSSAEESAGGESRMVAEAVKSNGAPSAAADAGSTAALDAEQKLRILVVDDNCDAADSMGLLLKARGHEPLVCYDGDNAVSLAEQHDPQVVILDIGLPDIDGYEVARRIRAQQNGASRTLIALTGWGQDADRAESAAAGFDHHLVKPADWAQIETIIAAHTASR